MEICIGRKNPIKWARVYLVIEYDLAVMKWCFFSLLSFSKLNVIMNKMNCIWRWMYYYEMGIEYSNDAFPPWIWEIYRASIHWSLVIGNFVALNSKYLWSNSCYIFYFTLSTFCICTSLAWLQFLFDFPSGLIQRKRWNFDYIQWISFISCCQDDSIGET